MIKIIYQIYNSAGKLILEFQENPILRLVPWELRPVPSRETPSILIPLCFAQRSKSLATPPYTACRADNGLTSAANLLDKDISVIVSSARADRKTGDWMLGGRTRQINTSPAAPPPTGQQVVGPRTAKRGQQRRLAYIFIYSGPESLFSI